MTRLEERYACLDSDEDYLTLFDVLSTMISLKKGSVDWWEYPQEKIERYKTYLKKCLDTWDDEYFEPDETLKLLIRQVLDYESRKMP
jgi:hypothetical protein